MSEDGSTTSGVGLSSRRLDDLPGLRPEGDGVLRGDGGEPAAGSGGDEGSALARAADLRFPDLKDLSGREKIDALVDHITETAIIRGELEHLRLSAHIELRSARLRLDELPVPRASKADQDAARRRANPELFKLAADARWTIERCTEAIARMGGSDYDAASRAYTLLSGS